MAAEWVALSVLLLGILLAAGLDHQTHTWEIVWWVVVSETVWVSELGSLPCKSFNINQAMEQINNYFLIIDGNDYTFFLTGLLVGLKVGAEVGFAVGDFVGLPGLYVGLLDGWYVGSSVGSSVGSGVGLPLE